MWGPTFVYLPDPLVGVEPAIHFFFSFHVNLLLSPSPGLLFWTQPNDHFKTSPLYSKWLTLLAFWGFLTPCRVYLFEPTQLVLPSGFPCPIQFGFLFRDCSGVAYERDPPPSIVTLIKTLQCEHWNVTFQGGFGLLVVTFKLTDLFMVAFLGFSTSLPTSSKADTISFHHPLPCIPPRKKTLFTCRPPCTVNARYSCIYSCRILTTSHSFSSWNVWPTFPAPSSTKNRQGHLRTIHIHPSLGKSNVESHVHFQWSTNHPFFSLRRSQMISFQ